MASAISNDGRERRDGLLWQQRLQECRGLGGELHFCRSLVVEQQVRSISSRGGCPSVLILSSKIPTQIQSCTPPCRSRRRSASRSRRPGSRHQRGCHPSRILHRRCLSRYHRCYYLC